MDGSRAAESSRNPLQQGHPCTKAPPLYFPIQLADSSAPVPISSPQQPLLFILPWGLALSTLWLSRDPPVFVLFHIFSESHKESLCRRECFTLKGIAKWQFFPKSFDPRHLGQGIVTCSCLWLSSSFTWSHHACGRGSTAGAMIIPSIQVRSARLSKVAGF